MRTLLYVGNLVSHVTNADLIRLFERFGRITCAHVIRNLRTGRSKGFGYVEIETDGDAVAAIAALDGQDHAGRCLMVNEVIRHEEGSHPGGAGASSGSD